ncbi:hypothetical protein G3I59_39395 [Amycolatopsis rubida]|uniref:CDP-Glycerol:Poly(Glycerophosphate) glycerophosphotransferase n=2 Tax=Amycolatopsis TaxID=1813 RepID=A0ABX0C106_9PSEU|nr:hypothetical protein [Amycolatopsis rubida]MYW96519.1 hypothetical protein [Amycolatopsis rubida]NEC61504.1 hypothetical protein [Amycolatopsis rubida]
MAHDVWVRGPIGLDAASRVTRPGCRTVLAMVPTVTIGTRLVELISLLEQDLRVQVMFTVPHSVDRWAGAEEYVRGKHGLLLPWEQAVAHRFDLVLAASDQQIDQVRGPLLLIGHGVGRIPGRRFSRQAGGATVETTAIDRQSLTFRGRVLPSVLGLGTDAEVEVLRDRCPEAVPAAVVAGDICLDGMRAASGLREQYRRALGVGSRRLVVLSSTWFTDSAFGRVPTMYEAIVAALPRDRYAVAAVLHPNIWAVHGRRQVTAWLGRCQEAGLRVIPPEQGWQATMIAADWVIGDHGSTTGYAAAMGRPVTLASLPDGRPQTGSVADVVRAHAKPLDPDQPLERQEEAAIAAAPRLAAAVLPVVSTRLDCSAGILRSAMYRLLELSEPNTLAYPPSPAVPLPLPGRDA